MRLKWRSTLATTRISRPIGFVGHCLACLRGSNSEGRVAAKKQRPKDMRYGPRLLYHNAQELLEGEVFLADKIRVQVLQLKQQGLFVPVHRACAGRSRL